MQFKSAVLATKAVETQGKGGAAPRDRDDSLYAVPRVEQRCPSPNGTVMSRINPGHHISALSSQWRRDVPRGEWC